LVGLILAVVSVAIGPTVWAAPSRIVRDINYYGDPSAAEETGDLYLPDDAGSPALVPTVLIIHGGGWSAGNNRVDKIQATAAFLQAHGFAAFAINYHLTAMSEPAPWPRNIEDCEIAVRWLRVNAKSYDIDPNRIAALGFSAGGHLAAMLAVAGPGGGLQPTTPYAGVSTAIEAAIDFYGPTVIRNGNTRFLPEAAGSILASQASPLTYVRPGLPPIMFVVGERDKGWLINEGRTFTSALGQAGVAHRMIVVPGAAHAFNPISRRTDVSGDILRFLDEHLGAPTPRS